MMELDGVSWNTEMEVTNADTGKNTLMKSFVSASREFFATHSDLSLNAMNRYLGLLASSNDTSIFSPGKVEVCAFYNSLWSAMSERDGPHWSGISCLIRAATVPSAREALTHTYRFMPVLAKLLSDALSLEQKESLLQAMQDISYNCKVAWQESYMHDTVRILTEWIFRSLSDLQQRSIGNKSLVVLTNICCSNRNVVNTLLGCVDVKDFIGKISSKEASFSGVSISRLLVCLGAPRRATNLHNYISLTLESFVHLVVERDSSQLLQAVNFIKELSSDSQYKTYLMSYQNYMEPLGKCVTQAVQLCSEIKPENYDFESNQVECLELINRFLTLFVKLDLFCLRPLHEKIVNFCMKASLICLPSSLLLLTALLKQYKDDDRLPPAIVSILRERLPALLAPPEPDKAGLEWLQLVSCLCDCAEVLELMDEHVTTQRFEDLFYGYLQYSEQLGTVGVSSTENAALEALQISLCKTNSCMDWANVTSRILTNNQVKGVLRSCINSSQNRSRMLHLIKHPDFPADKIDCIFSDQENLHASFESCGNSSSELASNHHAVISHTAQNGLANVYNGCTDHSCGVPLKEHAASNLIAKVDSLMKDNRITEITTLDVMDLYSYKMACIEQRMKGASDYVNQLQQIIAQTQANDARQLDILYKTQTQNERYKDQIKKLNGNLEDAENVLRVLKLKLNTERQEKDKMCNELTNKIHKQAESFKEEISAKCREMREQEQKLEEMQDNCRSLQDKLEQQTNKNSELACVLVKFEERVKQRDSKLEEAKSNENLLKKDLEQKEQSIKQLEKTLLERENRLRQTTTQLEEMKRVQDMVTKLMTGQR